jgi:hypothetical protein
MFPFFSRAKLLVGLGGWKKRRTWRCKILHPIQTRLATQSLEKIWLACQANSIQAQELFRPEN